MEWKLLHVDGIDCGGSERILEAQLEDLDGVDFVHADATTGTLAVTASEEGLESLRRLTRSLGYRFNEERAEEELTLAS